MRLKDHPSFPNAITCCFFAQDITHGGEAKLAMVNVRGVVIGRLLGGHHMAGFEVATHGRFWVATEGTSDGASAISPRSITTNQIAQSKANVSA